MFQKFNADTLESRFIKNLIYNTPIPIFSTVRKGDWLVTGCSYIYKRNLIRCLTSGFLLEGTPKATYKITDDYIFGKYYPKYTEKYSSNNIYYDHATHEMLGQYLRCYRDITGIDLMPFYNCFSGYYTDSFHIVDNGLVSGSDSSYKVALFPIRYNVKYTVAIDCYDNLSLVPVLLSNEIPITINYGGQIKDLSNALSDYRTTYSNASFTNCFTYSVDLQKDGQDIPFAKYLKQNEKHLYLAIQMPVTNTSSLTVLEGDYTNLNINKVSDEEDLSDLTEKELNSILLSPLSLLLINDKNSYAFSDRLLEYLALNVIDSEERIENNITRIQDTMGYGAYVGMEPGIWDDRIRYNNYFYYKDNYYTDPRIRFLDINGFVDKDVERLLLKGE